ncbi:MAG: ABC transporter ATP-binding protein [Candidatus Competibacterales bacterium]
MTPASSPEPTPLLTVEGVYAGYGRGDIVKGVDLVVHPGEIVTLLGPNGAGKSTLIKAICGVVKPRRGHVHLGDQPLQGRSPAAIARAGLAYVPQEGNVFRTLTVAENLEMGAWIDPQPLATRRQGVWQLFPELEAKRRIRAGLLSGGQRQMVALGMALMVEPKVLLLDEPSAGLSPVRVEELFDVVKRVNDGGVAVLMVEQNAVQALAISHRGYVLAAGQVALEGTARALLTDRDVGTLYLGNADTSGDVEATP